MLSEVLSGENAGIKGSACHHPERRDVARVSAVVHADRIASLNFRTAWLTL